MTEETEREKNIWKNFQNAITEIFYLKNFTTKNLGFLKLKFCHIHEWKKDRTYTIFPTKSIK